MNKLILASAMTVALAGTATAADEVKLVVLMSSR